MLERFRARHALGAGAVATGVAVVLLLILGSAGGGVAAGAQSRPLAADSAKLALSAASAGTARPRSESVAVHRPGVPLDVPGGEHVGTRWTPT